MKYQNPTILVLLASCSVGCGTTAMQDEPKPSPVSFGTVVVDAPGVGFDQELNQWSASIRAEHVLTDALAGNEVVIYFLVLGAVSADETQGLGIRLHSDSFEDFLTGSVVELGSRQDTGERNQVDANVDGTTFLSDGGTVTVSRLDAGAIEGTLTTELTPLTSPSGGTAEPLVATATFAGAIGSSCWFYDFEANDGTMIGLGMETPECAALFE